MTAEPAVRGTGSGPVPGDAGRRTPVAPGGRPEPGVPPSPPRREVPQPRREEIRTPAADGPARDDADGPARPARPGPAAGGPRAARPRRDPAARHVAGGEDRSRTDERPDADPPRPGAVAGSPPADGRADRPHPVQVRSPRRSPRRRSSLRVAAGRVDAATPAHRDRAVDALRAAAILGVVLGHWLVTALVPAAGPAGSGTSWRDLTPLASMPALAPLSWLFQTLAVFFFVGGYAAAKSLHGRSRLPGAPAWPWVRARMARLFRPVLALPLVWAPLAVVLALTGTDPRLLLRLAVNPLWFLCVYGGLTALTPLLDRLLTRRGRGPAHERLPLYGAAVAAALVAGADLARLGLGAPAWVGWVNVPAAWLVPYLLGMAWARGALASRRAALALFAGGAAAAVALVTVAGYPASMVGVPGAAFSNLDPPTAAAVAFGVAQAGLALLVRHRLARWMRRPVAWAAVALANLSAMTVFCWHQTAFMLVTLAGRRLGRLPGLHDAPVHGTWVAYRLLWLPVFALVLAVCLAVFRRFERPR